MEKSKFRYLPQFWTKERNLTWLLAALILDTFILNPLVRCAHWRACSRGHEQFSFDSHTLYLQPFLCSFSDQLPRPSSLMTSRLLIK